MKYVVNFVSCGIQMKVMKSWIEYSHDSIQSGETPFHPND